MCPGCPFRIAPKLTAEENEVIEIFNTISSPFVTQFGAFEFALAAFRPAMTTLEARRLLAALNKIHLTFYEYEQRKLERMHKKNAD